MARRKQDYRIAIEGYRTNGQPMFSLLVDGRKHRLKATTREAAEVEGKERFEQLSAPAPANDVACKPGTLRAGFAVYRASEAFKLYKPLTQLQANSSINLIMTTPAANGKHLLGESLLSDWLHDPEAPDAVRRVMAMCGTKWGAANHRLKALNNFFEWLLGSEAESAQARIELKVGKHARNPCRDVEKAKPKRTKDGRARHGHTPLTGDQVDDWLHAAKDDPEQYRAVRLLQMTGARVSDLHRLNRTMIKEIEGVGRVLTYTCEKGKDSAFWSADAVAVVPMVPELEQLVAELPSDRLTFIHSEWDRPFKTPRSMSNRVRKWRRDAGLPEHLSAHGMRKAATHWWLRNHRDLIANNFSLKTIFGWATDKELERYTADFDRSEEAKGMLVRLADRRRKA